ncbi:glutathione S-transferase [Gymnodinialimonas ceratoperidinii]|uniref:Glutathione S-transferase n=1 Tax=Gymnodinialimonas ceratoperidinii TaxID=2856823 RepID=A0A8F6YBD2_9RHOB|nr:glutathione S-transferase [Gymnodinialimonas ceratoperidinii]QXT40854.1 glutathione S-transferase [Gymnodinialimonas ceratoperidinii]
MTASPILWSFRRCPYAMRARGAILLAGQRVELREIVLRDKPEAFLRTSPSATVPALRLGDRVIDESLDIMIWALERNDPDGLLEMPDEGWQLIESNDGPFKDALDHTKYAVRHPEFDPVAERQKAAGYLHALEARLAAQKWLCGDQASLADHAIWPFVRQFANTDRAWFDAQPWPALIRWLDGFTEGAHFAQIMPKYTPWVEGDAPVWFGAP